jgi:hypothetical protein
LLAAGVLLAASAAGSDDRVVLLPRLQNGQTLFYESHARVSRLIKTKSNVATVMEPGELKRDLATGLKLSIQDFEMMDKRPYLTAETELDPVEQAAGGASAPKIPKVNFTIAGDGGLARADGLEELDPEQRISWQFWVAQFAFGWTLPGAGVKPGEKWKTVEAEKTPMPIAGLTWDRETSYVQNDTCPILFEQQCAVFLVKATLKQKSAQDDSTPEDYDLHGLKTSGVAKGANEIVLYVSLQTGLLVRATEDLEQFMDVTIAKVDGSNQVQYLVTVTSHFETGIVPAARSAPPSDAETIAGRVLAYSSNSLACLNGQAYWSILIRAQGPQDAQSRLIRVDFTLPCDKSPAWISAKPSTQNFRVIREKGCDAALPGTTEGDPKQHSTWPIWYYPPSAEHQLLPFGEVLPCYRSVDPP